DLMKDIFPFAHNLITDKDYYKDFRKSIGESGFRLETNSANWNEEEVVDKIDDYMSNFGVEMDFLEYVKASLRHMKKDINRYDIFTTAYLMLDMMGYKSDRLRKPADNMQNIQKDGEHAFYGAHCDYFITIDKNLKKKAKVLYSKFNISTKVFTPEEMINTLENVIHKKTININEFFKDILYYASQGTVFESHLLSDDNDIETYIIKLQIYFFNFFNYLIYNHYPNKNIIVIRFKKESFNYSDFNFYSEIDTLFTKLVSVFGYSSDDSVEKEFKMKKDEFIYKNTNNSFTWNFADAQVNLDKDPETHSPVLTCRIFLNKRKINEG
ncbi:hypothetical protein KAJ27_21040, partial [bacterium]|nr:hypothetical protein [bacterium]